MNKFLLIAVLGLLSTGALAVTCDTDEYLDTTCKPCDKTCATCSAGTADDCLTCDDGFYLSSGACKACDKTCATCSAGTATDCDSCPEGNGLDGTSGKCATCTVKNCDMCSLNKDACTVCTDGFYLKDSKTCTACTDSNCADCSDDKTCTECKDGFAVNDDDGCTACENNCKTCEESDDSCDACPTGQVLNNTNKDAAFCCPVNCTECKSAAFCTACADGSNLNKDKGTCFGFKTGASLTLGAIISVALFSLLF